MRSAVAGRHVLWRSQVSRSPTAACGGHPQRSSRIAAAACARRAPCEPFEAAPSFLCRGVDTAGKSARCPAIANFTLCGKPRRASYCVLCCSRKCEPDFGLWRCDSRLISQSGKVAQSSRTGRGKPKRRTDGRSATENASEARRARRKHHHRSADEPYHRPLATRASGIAP